MSERTKFRGYEISASAIGYSVYQNESCVAAGGVFGGGSRANVEEAKHAIRKLIAGTMKPLSMPSKENV